MLIYLNNINPGTRPSARSQELNHNDYLTLRSYYQSKTTNVRNDHLLVRLIKKIHVNLNYDIHEYLRIAVPKLIEASRVMDILSYGSKGHMRKGEMLSDDVPEIWYIYEHHLPVGSYSNDVELKPIRIINHPFTNLTYPYADGSMSYDYTVDTHLHPTTYLTIHADALAADYYNYVKNGVILQIPHTVSKYVATRLLPSIMEDYIDIASVNHVAALITGLETQDDGYRHILQERVRTDHMYTEIPFLERVNAPSYKKVTNRVRGVLNDGYNGTQKLPLSFKTGGVEMFEIMSRLNTVANFKAITTRKTKRAEAGTANKWRRLVKQTNNGRVLRRYPDQLSFMNTLTL